MFRLLFLKCFIIIVILIVPLFIFTTIVQAGELILQIDEQGPVLLNFNEFQPGKSLRYVLAPLITTNLNGSLKASFSELYIDWYTVNFGLSAGRRIISFGPGRYGYPMLGPLSQEPRSEGYDQIGYYFSWGNLKYQKFYAIISEQNFRSLIGQRATLDFGPFTFGFSETAVVNESAPMYFYTPLPFVPVYFYQFLGYHVFEIPGVNRTANLNVDFDVSWQITPELRVYAEYYMDDRPWPRLDADNNIIFPEPWKSPWRVGYQTGLGWDRPFGRLGLTLYGEYTRINQFTYTGLNPELTYTFGGRALGDPLGPDADRLNLELVSDKTEGWQWGIAWIHERHGEGKIGDVWEPVPGRTEVFLTGVVETTDRVAVTITRKFNSVKFSATAGISNVVNMNNIPASGQMGLDLKIIGIYKY